MCKKVLDVGWALPPPALTACRATLVLDGRKGGQELGEDFPISPTQTQIFQIYFYVCHFLRVQKPLWNSTYSIYIELKGGVGEKYQKYQSYQLCGCRSSTSELQVPPRFVFGFALKLLGHQFNSLHAHSFKQLLLLELLTFAPAPKKSQV